jgi:peptide-methionine (S)-S-oxide reductase
MAEEIATLAGGCFWCIEPIFGDLRGVISVESGYTGGHVADPTYEQVCSKRTGHAEAVQVRFDPQHISYAELLDIFFHVHDPTTKDRQGNDIGPQYRSAIFTHSDEQAEQATAAIGRAQPSWPQPIVTEIAAAGPWYRAEGYHQRYYEQNADRNPYCAVVITPKLAKFRKNYADQLKSTGGSA